MRRALAIAALALAALLAAPAAQSMAVNVGAAARHGA